MSTPLSWQEIKERFDKEAFASIHHTCGNCGTIVKEEETTVGKVLNQFDGVVNVDRNIDEYGDLVVENVGGWCSDCLLDAGIDPSTGLLLRH